MGLSPQDLNRELLDGLERTRWRVSKPLRFRRYAIWLTNPTVLITTPTTQLCWRARIHDYRGWGFTRSQAKQMLRALARSRDEELGSFILDTVHRDHAQ